MEAAKPQLIVFAGLPGVGKTTLARALSSELNALYLRIDAIEQALRDAGIVKGEMGPMGYEIAYALAKTNLELGRLVVADAVNPIRVTREAWRNVARETKAALVEIEVLCGDLREHRKRVADRVSDIPGLVLPSWEEIVSRQYEPWDGPRIVIDTAKKDIVAAMIELRAKLPNIP